MADLKTPFRYDYVGSFLRPEALKQARKNFEEGKITKEELTAVEDDCIRDLVGKIKKLGYHVITDGEFRRSTWHLDFMWGFQGIEHRKTVEGNTTFDAEAAMIDDTYMVGKISVKNHPFVEHFKFVKALEDENTVAKQTIPSPGQFYAYFTGAELLGTTLDIPPLMEREMHSLARMVTMEVLEVLVTSGEAEVFAEAHTARITAMVIRSFILKAVIWEISLKTFLAEVLKNLVSEADSVKMETLTMDSMAIPDKTGALETANLTRQKVQMFMQTLR